MPMMASCGMRALLLLWMDEKTAAPTNVNARLTQYTEGACGSPPENGISSAIVAPSAAICASERSTKMTPRSTTCTPRYEWMPVRIRLATNGAARKSSIARRDRSPILARPRLLDRVHQQVDVVVEQLKVVVHFLHSADGRQHDENLGP